MSHSSGIEFFIRDCPLPRIIAWVKSRIGELGPPYNDGPVSVYPSPIGPVVLTPEIENGAFTSVWFNTSCSPWASDLDCARCAAADLGCVVRCDPGLSHPEVEPLSDVVLEIDGELERLVSIPFPYEILEP